ncbi:hypothetical protein D3C81_1647210 [compost metagenome]
MGIYRFSRVVVWGVGASGQQALSPNADFPAVAAGVVGAVSSGFSHDAQATGVRPLWHLRGLDVIGADG